MNEDIWSDVDDYICERLLGSDEVLELALRDSDETGLLNYFVAPTQGKLLNILVRMQGARRILELGTLAGYSTIWLARALPEGGRLITVEIQPEYAAIAQKNIALAGLSHLVEIRVGKAIDVLPSLQAEGLAPFDLIFIDADKAGYPEYLEWSLKLSRPGTVIIGDNVVRKGQLADPTSSDPRVIGVRRFIEQIAQNPRLSATVIQTVGSKGYDGFAVAIVTS